MSNAVSLTSASFDERTASGVSLVDFWASWCGPCRMLSPVIDEIAEEFAGKCSVYKVNVDEEGELAVKFGIMSIPTLIFFKDGEVINKLVGVVPKEEITAILENA